MPHTRRKVWLGIAVAVALDVAVQIAWKGTANRVPDTTPIFTIVKMLAVQPMTYVLITLFLTQFFNWLIVLGRADLSYAQPITAGSYVLVAIGAVVFLHEHLPPTRWVGLLFIMVGVFLISRTKHKTTGTIPMPTGQLP
jgi:drug/metabolite transporter (DMT)-like permease